MTFLRYLTEYTKVNPLFTYALLLFALLSSVKYLPFFRQVRISPRWLLCLILLTGLALRVGWLWGSAYEPVMHGLAANPTENDLMQMHAVGLTQGKWFLNPDGTASGRRPIGYPMLLGACYQVFGVDVRVVWVLHLVLFAVTALLVYRIGKEIFGRGPGLVAAFFYSIYPVSVYSVKLITDEHLFLPVWFAGLALLLYECRTKVRPWSWLVYGVLFGYAAMIRTHVIFMPLVMALTYALKRFSWRVVLGTSFLTLFVMQAVNVPWVIRNYRAWGVPVVYTATSCFIFAQLHTGVTPEGGTMLPKKGEPDYSEELENAPNEGVAHAICSRQMKRWIVAHPAEFLDLGISRVLLFMHWNRWGGVWPLFYQFDQGGPGAASLQGGARKALEEIAYEAYYFLLHSFLVALLFLWLRRKALLAATKTGLAVLGFCFFFYLCEHMIIYPDRKYRFPLEPLMMIVAAYGLEKLIRGWRWEAVGAKGLAVFRWIHGVMGSKAPRTEDVK
ncbi:MAG: glycosyltransferase family 39 protein [Candidatus Omnitrophota bacterium]|jgi:4-amino-4-deoxy-L-arabinose transferase-like glycosyltransferase